MSKGGFVGALVVAVLVGAIGGWFFSERFGSVALKNSQNSKKLYERHSVVANRSSRVQSNAPSLSSSSLDNSEFEFTPGLRSRFDLQLALYQRAEAANVAQLSQLIDRAQGRLAGTDYAFATQILYGRMADLDVQAAIQSVQRSNYFRKLIWFQTVFRSFGHQDIEAALSQAKALPEAYRKSALAAALVGIEHEPYERRLAMGKSAGIQPQLQLSGRDPRDAWLEVRSISNPQTRLQQSNSLLASITDINPALALELVEELAVSDRSAALQQIINRWSREDATSAMVWIQNHSQDPGYSNYLRSAIRPLAKQNSDLLKEVIAQQSAQLRPELSGVALRALARNNPDAAASWFVELTARGDLVGDADDFGRILGGEGLDFVERWQESLPERVAETAWASALLMEASKDPTGTAALVGRIEKPNLKAAVVPGVTSVLATVDPQGAMDWLLGLDLAPDDEHAGFQALTARLDEQDIAAIHSVAEKLDDPKKRDSLLGAMAFAPNIDAKRLEQMRDQVSGGLAKMELTVAIYDRLQTTDPGKAETFRVANNLNRNGWFESSAFDECLRLPQN